YLPTVFAADRPHRTRPSGRRSPGETLLPPRTARQEGPHPRAPRRPVCGKGRQVSRPAPHGHETRNNTGRITGFHEDRIMGTPKTLYDKIWDSHVVDKLQDETYILYIDRHLVHEVTSPQAFEGLRAA